MIMIPSTLDITPIGNALHANTSLIYLDISANYLNDDDIQSLIHSLENNTTLENIQLMGIHYVHHGGSSSDDGDKEEVPDGFIDSSYLTVDGWKKLFSARQGFASIEFEL